MLSCNVETKQVDNTNQYQLNDDSTSLPDMNIPYDIPVLV